jgi:hypothetical protein
MSADDSLRDPALARLFRPEHLPLPSALLRGRITAIPVCFPRALPSPRFQLATVLAVGMFMLLALGVWARFGASASLPMEDLKGPWQFLAGLLNRGDLLPVPSRSGLWLAIGCALTLVGLGALSGGDMGGARLRRD